MRILTEPKNAIVRQYKKLLAMDEVDLEFTEDALHAIAKQAKEKKVGARALRAIIEESCWISCMRFQRMTISEK